MYKLFVFVALLAVVLAAPAPEAKAKPSVVAYSTPLVAAAAPVAYSAAYGAPLTYAAAPLAYSAYPAYSASYVTVF